MATFILVSTYICEFQFWLIVAVDSPCFTVGVIVGASKEQRPLLPGFSYVFIIIRYIDSVSNFRSALSRQVGSLLSQQSLFTWCPAMSSSGVGSVKAIQNDVRHAPRWSMCRMTSDSVNTKTPTGMEGLLVAFLYPKSSWFVSNLEGLGTLLRSILFCLAQGDFHGVVEGRALTPSQS